MFRPFKTGDFVDAGGVSGAVESINSFSTTLKTPDNREIIVPNGSIFSGSITNFSAQPTRRVDMVFGIGYGDDLRKAKEVLEGLIAADERILKDPAPVKLAFDEQGISIPFPQMDVHVDQSTDD